MLYRWSADNSLMMNAPTIRPFICLSRFDFYERSRLTMGDKSDLRHRARTARMFPIRLRNRSLIRLP